MNETVLVTGGTGFVGSWCVAQLLERGYRVRTTVRDLAAEGRVRAVMSGAVDSATLADWPDRLEVVAADLGADDGWAQAAGGVDVVLHVASPMADALDRLLDAAERLPHGAQRSELMTAGFVDQVVTAHRTLGAVNLGDPALRRDLAIARRLEALSLRGLHLLHGDHPTPDQAAGFWLAQDLGPVLRRLTGLDDDELRDVLTRLCRRLWMATGD